MSQPLDLKNPGRVVHVGVILPNSTNEILDVAPIDAIHSISKETISQLPDEMVPPHLKEQAIDLQIHWVSETGKAPGLLTGGLKVIPTDSYETCPPLDIVLIGAQSVTYQANEADLAFIRKAYASCAAFLTICGGMLAPMQAGILQGRKATAPRFMLEALRRDNPGVAWQEKRWVRDGKVWSSGALLNGLELMRAFLEETWGRGGGAGDDIVAMLLSAGCWPRRDVDYKDDLVKIAVSWGGVVGSVG